MVDTRIAEILDSNPDYEYNADLAFLAAYFPDIEAWELLSLWSGKIPHERQNIGTPPPGVVMVAVSDGHHTTTEFTGDHVISTALYASVAAFADAVKPIEQHCWVLCGHMLIHSGPITEKTIACLKSHR